ncbi:hypothetical protein MKW92_018959 [Papaver armeniacum]|nr:hypothetical protein MKW92_018959 [Papaver armeniacum]
MGHTQQTGRRLKEFADSIYFPFRFEQILLENEEDYERIDASNKLIANCMIHQLHKPHRNFASVKCFLNGIRKLSPKMIIITEEEILNFTKIPSVSEEILNFTKIPSIWIFIDEEQFPFGSSDKKSWEDGFSLTKGYQAILLTSYCYWVQHEKCKLGLCWKSRPLISTTVWVPL